MEIPIKMDDLGVPPFSETPICYFIMGIHGEIYSNVHPRKADNPTGPNHTVRGSTLVP